MPALAAEKSGSCKSCGESYPIISYHIMDYPTDEPEKSILAWKNGGGFGILTEVFREESKKRR